MEHLFKIKVWKDRMAKVYPEKWCWEVLERTNAGKTVGCGTTFSESKSRAVATRLVEARVAELRERFAAAQAAGLRGGSSPSDRFPLGM